MQGLPFTRLHLPLIALALLTATPLSAGPYRNAYLCGSMPWHRSFHDVNLCTGNLIKSFTDIQVAPARGAGLVLQRTYNSNDDRIDGAFGHGWTHAYDIRMEEASSIPSDLLEKDEFGDPAAKEDRVVRTDFFGGKHVYKRDADGLYTPPPYMHDWTKSDYSSVLEVGPGDVNEDIQIGLDGTTKHFIAQGNVRVCDYIEDRNGNRSSLAYDPDGNLDTVTDPSDRVLDFTWTNFGTTQSPHWRITQIIAPLQKATYEYYRPQDYNNVLPAEAGGEWYNLKSVHLDPDGLNRTTTYTYTTHTGTGGTACGLLAAISDPLGHTVQYEYAEFAPTDTVWVSVITEPAGVDEQNNPRLQSWEITPYPPVYNNCVTTEVGAWDSAEGIGCYMFVNNDGPPYFRAYQIADSNWGPEWWDGSRGYYLEYDDQNNVTAKYDCFTNRLEEAVSSQILGEMTRGDHYTYGRFGNVLSHWVDGFQGNWLSSEQRYERQDTYTYYTEDKYFQKASVADAAGHVTTFDYGDRYGSSGERGNVLWVRDATQQPDGAAFAYEYNQYGQKVSETNLNGVVTTFEYGDDWGNLTRVVQDPGQGHLGRTTDLVYDEAGRVTDKTDPMGRTSYVDYNGLGQPDTATFPAPYAETVSYSYGGNGRLDSVSVDRGGGNTLSTGMEYEDGCDRVSSVTETATGPQTYTHSTSYTYNLFGALKTKTLPGSGTWTYEYGGTQNPFLLMSDDLNNWQMRLSSITDNEGRRVDYHYNQNGALSYVDFAQTLDDGEPVSYCRTDYYYDSLQFTFDPNYYFQFYTHPWLARTANTFHWKDEQGVWQEKLFSQNLYGWDDVGNRTSNAISLRDASDQLTTRTEGYGYDELYRLTSVNYGDGASQTYTFDDMGNRLTRNSDYYGYNAANMLVRLNSQTDNYSNDANGNTLSGGGRTNTWDSQNRLVQCVYGTTTSAFTYGADGLRRSMTINGGTPIHFALDGQSVVQEGHIASNQFVPDVTYLNGPRGVEYRKDENTGELRWYLYDGLGSVVAEVDEDGAVTATRKYDVYGSVRGSTGSSDSQHKFVGGLGHATEPDTGGLIYMRARWMDPALGRFISEDPAGDGENWYAYCDSNPVNAVDTTGEAKIRISKDFWVRWDDVKSHIHWGRGNEELGAATREGRISHRFRFQEFPSNSEMKSLQRKGLSSKAAAMAYDSITAAMQISPLFVIGLFLDIAGDFDAADQFYQAAGVR